jgi:hypothetical protein
MRNASVPTLSLLKANPMIQVQLGISSMKYTTAMPVINSYFVVLS